jgi:hypothetical protein
MSAPTPYDDHHDNDDFDDDELERALEEELLKRERRVCRAGRPDGRAYGGHGGFGTPVTGATLTKLKSVATAKYAGASVERANMLPDGSYEVHVIQSNGTELHVLVSKDFKVTGTEQGGGPGGSPPAGYTAPSTGTQS